MPCGYELDDESGKKKEEDTSWKERKQRRERRKAEDVVVEIKVGWLDWLQLLGWFEVFQVMVVNKVINRRMTEEERKRERQETY